VFLEEVEARPGRAVSHHGLTVELPVNYLDPCFDVGGTQFPETQLEAPGLFTNMLTARR